MASIYSSEDMSEATDSMSETELLTDPTIDVGLDGEGELSLDEVFDVLKNERRRLVLRYLHTESPETTLSELAAYVAAAENEKDAAMISSAERKRAYVSLYQCHLPRMDRVGLLDFDEDRKSVTFDDSVEFDRYVEFIGVNDEDSSMLHSARMAVVGGSLFVLQYLFVSGAWLSGFVLGAGLTLLAALSLPRLDAGIDPRPFG